MAKVGQRLTAPESGWRRYDDTDSAIHYNGEEWYYSSGSSYPMYYNSGYHSNGKVGSSITFKFKGTKLRILGVYFSFESSDVSVDIDGIVEHYNSYNNTSTWSDAYAQVILYEKVGLNDTEHIVKITNNVDKLSVLLDAIDIDATGYLVGIETPANLTAIGGETKVTLSWSPVDFATGYNIKRSTTAGGTYTTIATNVSGTSYIDTAVSNGTTYYYVVTAGDSASEESDNSNEASATPAATSKVILRVTMIDSSEREYELSSSEIDGFVIWRNSEINNGKLCYMLNKKVGSQNSMEYLAFERIISFDVIPLKD